MSTEHNSARQLGVEVGPHLSMAAPPIGLGKFGVSI